MRRWTIAAGLSGIGAFVLAVECVVGVFLAARPCGADPRPEPCGSLLVGTVGLLTPLVIIVPLALAPPASGYRLRAVALACLGLAIGPVIALVIAPLLAR